VGFFLGFQLYNHFVHGVDLLGLDQDLGINNDNVDISAIGKTGKQLCWHKYMLACLREIDED
jgi:hypothetical protein